MLSSLFQQSPKIDLGRYAPRIVSLFTLSLVLAGDARLWHYLQTQTGLWWLAALGVAPSAIGFLIWWEIAHRYRAANDWQLTISAMMALASLALAGVGGWAEYVSLATGAPAVLDLPMFYAVVMGLYMAHILAGLVWVMVDDRLAAQRAAERERERMVSRRMAATLAGESLEAAEATLARIRALETRYGREAVGAILSRMGLNLPPATMPARAHPEPATMPPQPSPEPATMASTPQEAEARPPFGHSGNGKSPEL